MRRILTTAATTTKRSGIGTVRISNEEIMEKERTCAMWRIVDVEMVRRKQRWVSAIVEWFSMVTALC
ncbi:hypothetical protein Bca4012_037006 [Brassica carinata]